MLLKNLSVLHDANIEKISAMGRATKNARAVFDYLEQNPIIDIGKTAEELNLAFSTVSLAVNRLVDAEILVQTNNANRNRVFAYEDYLAILRKDT